MININFLEKIDDFSEVICFFVDDEKKISKKAKSFDEISNSLITKFLEDSKNFKGKIGDVKLLTTSSASKKIHNIILVGIGNDRDLSNLKIEQIGGIIGTSIKSISNRTADVEAFPFGDKDKIAANIASGILLSTYSFEKYFTTKKEDEYTKLECVNIEVNNQKLAEKSFEHSKSIVCGVYLARDFITEPANVVYPESASELIYEYLSKENVSVEVFGEAEMKNMGMNALLGVGQGSIKESKMVVMRYNGLEDDSEPVALVGKGVTFDSGGISIKPALNMHEMKCDMAGSAAVVGVIKALAMRKAKVNVVGVVGLVENMPGGNAQRPGDVVKSMSGQTIEILNTDAEGRLILADLLWYTQSEFKPKIMINLATLTGAILVTFGSLFSGLFSNDDELSNKLLESSTKTGENLWRLPIGDEFAKMIKSEIADIANIGSPPGYAGSITGAQFLAKFVNNVPWAHIDIAGSAWEKKGSYICPKGAVGYGVRLLDKFLHDNYEKN